MSARIRAVTLAGAAALLFVWQYHVFAQPQRIFFDFRAFYCAAHTLLAGGNPYGQTALYACESTPAPFGLAHTQAGVAVPAPLPGYALLAFAPLAALPYIAASALWALVELLCVALCARALSTLVRLPAEVTLWCLACAFAVMSVPYGELGAPLVAAVLWTAVALRRRAWWLAAVAVACALLVPNAGLPVALGVFVIVPQMRVPLLIVAALLCALDAAAGGFPAMRLYFTQVLPAHARSEIGDAFQFSLTWVLHAMHFSDPAALAGAQICYVVMTIAGIVAARLLVRRRQDLALAALIPPAFAVLGGAHIHYTQIALAIPAAMLLYGESGPRVRPVFAAALLLLAFPWLWLLGEPAILIVFVPVCALLAATVLGWKEDAALRAALGTAMLAGAILLSAAHFGPGYSAEQHAALRPDLAQSNWAAFMNSKWSSTSLSWWIAKAPTWLGLLALISGCALELGAAQMRRAVSYE